MKKKLACISAFIIAVSGVAGCTSAQTAAAKTEIVAIKEDIETVPATEATTTADTEVITEASQTNAEAPVSEETTEATNYPASEETTAQSATEGEITTFPEITPTFDYSEEELLARGVNKLGKYILNQVEGSDSAVISGFSGYSALAEAEYWADTPVVDEIQQSLGYINHEVLQEIKDNEAFETGTMFIVDDSLRLNTQDTSKFTFKDMHSNDIVDFVNNYVKEKTHDMIPTVLNSPFLPETQAAIVDTLYFKGTWTYKFEKENTREDIFYGRDRETTVEFMRGYEEYGVDVDNKIIQLPYRNTSLVMDVIYELDGTATQTYEKYVNLVRNRLDLSYDYDVTLKMPKFETETTAIITSAYIDAGMVNTFSGADGYGFTKLADDLAIGTVLQKAKIIVDEEGTEAAAVTIMSFDATCVMPDEKKRIEIDVNKPFVYAIRDTESDVILFSGYVYNF